MLPTRLLLLSTLLPIAPLARAQQSFVNWETPHVSPLALSADGTQLYAANTPDGRLEVFDVTGDEPVPLFSVPVGLDPVSVRPRTANEVWVVNHVSDSISVVDLSTRNVVRTIDTDDEPCDVVFAGNPERAFVSCSQFNQVQVFDPSDLTVAPLSVPIEGEEPRAMAVSSDGGTVYVAVFESGNHSTVLGGGLASQATITLNNVVTDPLGPYGGQNPPPNDGAGFTPPLNPNNNAPPAVGLIVKKDVGGNWMDDNNGDWTDLVSGANASRSNRPVGWDVVDNDVVAIDAQTLAVSYVEGLMNICMALAVNPANGRVSVVGTDGTNEIRFEPNLTGVFLRVQLALANATTGAAAVSDLNGHLDYSTGTVAQPMRDQSLGDPRGIVWNAAGDRAYVAGMGSNNVVVIDASGARVGTPVEVGEGPTGIALDDATGRVFVLNKFASSISTIDAATAAETSRTPFHDASPTAIKVGRKHLYGTHETSGLGQIACASCHVDARMDRIGWDLGDPSGDIVSSAGQNRGMGVPGLTTGFTSWHPMKGPMTTQTLQDIIGKEPLHWRGDRNGLEDFNPAFVGLQGDDVELTPTEMQEYEDFLATITFPPNPYREFDNRLSTSLDTGLVSVGRFTPRGTPLPAGDATTGLSRYTNSALDGNLRCVTCHTLPTGMGPDMTWNGSMWTPFPVGPNGERHHGMVSVDGSTQRAIKIPQTRNEIEKDGFSLTAIRSLSGFGVLHDGSIPGIVHFLSSPAFSFNSEQDLANMIAFMMSFAGSDLPDGSVNNIFFPPGTASNDTHAGVGTQTTLVQFAGAPQEQLSVMFAMLNEANAGRVGLIVKSTVGGIQRGAALIGGSMFQLDRAADVLTLSEVWDLAAPGSEQTWTVVPAGSEIRLGIDRDEDGFFDRDELDLGSDPANSESTPDIGNSYCGPAVPNSSGAAASIVASGSPVVANEDLTLLATGMPAGQFGYFLASRTQGFLMPPGSQGNICLSGNIGRFNAVPLIITGPSGSIEVDLTAIPVNPPEAVMPAETWNFQCWFRDVGGTSNFTDGVEILFQ
ncbi:MAG: hypothetical protein GY711_23190 [bacterium]|nr:hypothetical protein [bacterium]